MSDKKKTSWIAFRAGPDRKKNVFLDWLGEFQPSAMVGGYGEAADLVVAGSAADVRHPDRHFYPVAFLYRHASELQLKLPIELGRALNDEDSKAPHGHMSSKSGPTETNRNCRQSTI